MRCAELHLDRFIVSPLMGHKFQILPFYQLCRSALAPPSFGRDKIEQAPVGPLYAEILVKRLVQVDSSTPNFTPNRCNVCPLGAKNVKIAP